MRPAKSYTFSLSNIRGTKRKIWKSRYHLPRIAYAKRSILFESKTMKHPIKRPLRALRRLKSQHHFDSLFLNEMNSIIVSDHCKVGRHIASKRSRESFILIDILKLITLNYIIKELRTCSTYICYWKFPNRIDSYNGDVWGSNLLSIYILHLHIEVVCWWCWMVW